MEMNSETIVSEMIEVAANEAKITQKQSLECVRAALLFVQKKSVEIGPLDLSAIGFYVAARSTAPLVSKNKAH